MTFDWQSFLEARSIPFVTKGASATRGNVAIKCPMCNDDPSEHMAISLTGKGWRCWRNEQHRGRNPARLIAALLHCSLSQAHEIVGTRRHMPHDFMAALREKLEPHHDADDNQRLLDLPSEFKSFDGRSALERPFTDYLARRGYDDPTHLSGVYGLRYARRGLFRYRIIFPVRFEDRLVNWTGRTITDNPLRYMTLSTDHEHEPTGVGPISDYLLWFDELMRDTADTIVLTEGPFDALRVNYLGERHGICATCFFTIAPSRRQVDLLHTLLPRFKHRVLLQDAGATAAGLRTNAALTALKVRSMTLPANVKDPGELTTGAFFSLANQLRA